MCGKVTGAVHVQRSHTFTARSWGKLVLRPSPGCPLQHFVLAEDDSRAVCSASNLEDIS